MTQTENGARQYAQRNGISDKLFFIKFRKIFGFSITDVPTIQTDLEQDDWLLDNL